MLGSLFTLLENWEGLIYSPVSMVYALFSLWMLIDALRRKEYLWAILICTGFGCIWYFMSVYRGSSSPTSGFELPGSHDRKRIKELEAQIHHLDKGHHYLQLGDILFQQGKLARSEAAYRAGLEREPGDIDGRAHLGQCLLRQKRAAEARPLLESVVSENPKHDYGHSMMALAETYSALGETQKAIQALQQVTASNSYPRAKVQLAELYVVTHQTALAQAELRDVLSDDIHAPAFQRKRDRVWIRRAKSLNRKIRGV